MDVVDEEALRAALACDGIPVVPPPMGPQMLFLFRRWVMVDRFFVVAEGAEFAELAEADRDRETAEAMNRFAAAVGFERRWGRVRWEA